MPHYGLIGKSLAHSFSKKYFDTKFEKEGLSDFTYSILPLEKIEDISSFLLNNKELNGFNITIPFKTSILSFLDEIDPEAKEIGAVNTVVIENTPIKKRLKGFNTDVWGFEKSLIPFLGNSKPRALVLGTGGASRAVVYVLNKLQIPFLQVSRGKKMNQFIGYKDLDQKIILEYQLIINTTPLGMYPNSQSFPDIPYTLLTPTHFLYDLVYNPEETMFLNMGKKLGCRTLNGIQMLYLQADKSFSLWKEQLTSIY